MLLLIFQHSSRVKANGQFWYMAKMKIYIIYFFLLMQNFIELYMNY